MPASIRKALVSDIEYEQVETPAHAGFADAVSRHLEREGTGIEAYVDELRERNPFRAEPAR